MLLGAGCAVQTAGAEPQQPVAHVSPPASPSVTGTTPAPSPTPTPPVSARPTGPQSPQSRQRAPQAAQNRAQATEQPAATAASPSRPASPPPMLQEGAEGPKVRELQARLRQAGHFGLNPTGYYGTVTTDAVSAFQERQGLPVSGQVATATWSALTSRTQAPTRQELYPPTTLPITDPDPRCLTGRALCISKKSRTLVWMVDGRMVSAMDVRFGSERTPTREGAFGVTFKSRHHHSTLYDSPMPYAMFFSGGQAVHYSADFAARGYNGASHGCVNVRDEKKIAALFDQVKPGDKVIVY
ncbi:MAG TPA: L,D-transpeptidase family protein [Streptomyces sp.]|nr:L,D-transpeptidase family protein [Streptomyces sp.]